MVADAWYDASSVDSGGVVCKEQIQDVVFTSGVLNYLCDVVIKYINEFTIV